MKGESQESDDKMKNVKSERTEEDDDSDKNYCKRQKSFSPNRISKTPKLEAIHVPLSISNTLPKPNTDERDQNIRSPPPISAEIEDDNMDGAGALPLIGLNGVRERLCWFNK